MRVLDSSVCVHSVLSGPGLSLVPSLTVRLNPLQCSAMSFAFFLLC